MTNQAEGTWEEWAEYWRLEREREDEMLAFYNECDAPITFKFLAEKFSLKPTRVSLLIRKQEHARILAENERLKTHAFNDIAKRLWMDLDWLASTLEHRNEPR